MFLVIRLRKAVLFVSLFLCAAIPVCLLVFLLKPDLVPVSSVPEKTDQAVMACIDKLVAVRNGSLLRGDLETIERFYNTKVRNGLYAYDHEVKKTKYLKNWAQKQGVQFISIKSRTQKKWIKADTDRITVNFLASTEYRYVYRDRPEVENVMRIGTYHEIVLHQYENVWLISREWYTDPFADALDLENIDMEEERNFILSQKAARSLDINDRRLRAVEYADTYCGAASSGENGYDYNKEYKNYNHVGGDCANFVSQVLYAGGFKKTGTWNYHKDGSRAWLKSQALKDFMLYSGRASLLAYGSYGEVLKASYKLLPGDIVAYWKKGKVVHVAVVTGADSRGYTLVNCHNTDRYRVPWDLGWSDSRIRFYLLRVHY